MTIPDTATTPAVNTRLSGTDNRLHFMDHLRAVVVVMVIVLHTSMTYMTYPPEWWYVIEPRNSLVFTLVVLFLDVPNMQILFFIAGFFGYPSLERYGASRFFRQKLVRIGIPWLVGVVFFAPAVTYLITVTRGIAKPYFEFWFTDFWGGYFQQSVYWFLGILLSLFALMAVLVSSTTRWRHVERQSVQPAWPLFVNFWAAMTLWFFIWSTVMPADSWNNSMKLLVFQPARLLLYVGYFCLGVYADRKGWLRGNGYQPSIHSWLPVALATGFAYLALRLSWLWGSGLQLLALQSAFFNAFCLSGLMSGLALFQRYFDPPNRLWSSLARNAFAIYYVHPLILYPAAYAALFIEHPIFVEAAFLIGFTTIAAWVLGALILTRWPVLREVF
jgi:surface polysaccharide O-acyltransferase-like enzyme